ncbi:hypothetical protein DPMN_188445 [Dreissena polymorpha]|uniref:Uncharacterized protein n=1 Tax=Dreissena polymorpha TaxID=45954 RepID=A0A9D4DSF5_DREPO|nr:hypothetical protein DPMN_188324 [Dreissena polymorpha]KAH3753795.1 hypothetical protein DPMN_188445 [Dreissena polymorpha]
MAIKKNQDIPMPRQMFNGKSSWERFVNPFKALAGSCGWNDQECHFRPQSSIQSEAADFAFNQTIADTLETYSKLKSALETRSVNI